LQFRVSNIGRDKGAELNLLVQNVGTGPARVVWMEMRHAGQPLQQSRDLVWRLAKAAGQPLSEEADIFTMSGSISGDVLPPGENRVLLAWSKDSANSAEAQKAYQLVNRGFSHLELETTACYCSVFDECWETQFQGQQPKPVAQCEAKGHVLVNG